MEKREMRDARIEMMRVIACFFVIMIHLPNRITLMDAFTCNAVPVFFAITGCFWFRSRRGYGHIVLHFAETVLLPLVVFQTLAQIFNNWFSTADLSLSASQLSAPDLVRTLQGLLKVDYTYWQELGGHTWYVADFITLVLFYLPMRAIAQSQDKKVKLTVTLIVLFAVLCIELQHVIPLDLQGWLPDLSLVFPSYFVMMMIGQELYSRNEALQRHRWISPAALLGFLLVTALRYLTHTYFVTVDGSQPFFSAASMFSYASLPLIFLVFLPLKLPGWLSKVSRGLGSCTYAVYLVHSVVIRKLTAMGVFDRLLDAFLPLTPKLYINYCLCGAAGALLVMAISLVLVLPWQGLVALVRRMKRKYRPVKN